MDEGQDSLEWNIGHSHLFKEVDMNELRGYVDAVVFRASERLSALSHEKLVPLLERRIQEADDKGAVTKQELNNEN